MISQIWGTVLDIDHEALRLTLKVQGGGYALEVLMPRGSLLGMSQDESVHLQIQMVIREDSWTLYGFSSSQEKHLFQLLTGVKGIGPKTALDILGSSPSDIARAILDADTAFLTSIKGLGKKTAERAIVELQESSELLQLAQTAASDSQSRSIPQDAIDGLITLGFPERQVRSGLKEAPEEIQDDTQALIKWYLREAK